MQSLISDWVSPSVYASLLLLATSIFFWDGMDILTPFLFPFVEMAVWALFALVFVGAVVKAFTSTSEPFDRRFRFVALDLAVGLIAYFFPFTQVRNTLDFNLNFNQRTAVVEMIKDGKLSRPHDYNQTVYALPVGWQHLSKGGGEVIVNNKNPPDHSDQGTRKIDTRSLHVFFYTFRGILDRHSGFEYAADGKPTDASEAKEIVPLRENWFWLSF
jgi:hypothetical protein